MFQHYKIVNSFITAFEKKSVFIGHVWQDRVSMRSLLSYGVCFCPILVILVTLSIYSCATLIDTPIQVFFNVII